MRAGVFERMADDLRALLRVLAGRGAGPTGAVLDRRTVQSTPSSGHRAGDDGAQRRRGHKAHAAVDTLGHLLALVVTPADVDDRDVVGALCRAVQEAAGETVEVAWVDQGYTGARASESAGAPGVRLEVVKHAEPKRGFVLLPRR